MKSVQKKLANIGEVFRINGKLYAFNVLANGNINTTYSVKYRRFDGSVRSYIIQRINGYVFKDPADIMANIDGVTKHLATKVIEGRVALKFYYTEEGKNYYVDEEGNYWRIMNDIDSVTFNVCSDLKILRSAGKAFGEFQMQLSDYDASSLAVTIPDFHNTKKRLDKFFEDVEADPCGRVAEVMPEIDTIRSMRRIAVKLTELQESGKVPLRVTHNDTKINNVLFHKKTGEPLVVIDLDTVMPGLAMHDFGDAIRFAANTAAEDEPDLTKVSLDLDKFRAFSEGFISQTAGALTEMEIGTMALGALTITIELASRFLDDYITGDKYFKTNYDGHNLVRARCQLKLAEDMWDKYEQMEQIVTSIAHKA